MDEAEIQSLADTDVLESTLLQAVEVLGSATYGELQDRWEYIRRMTVQAFATASAEDKVTREDMLERVAAPQVIVSGLSLISSATDQNHRSGSRKEVMRKHMNRVIAEVMEQDESVVYLGEDVRHGGYYVVTEGLAKQFPDRVLDFPPDETSLLGAAMGFSQVGLTPIVEIPYAKYLDCGADMFYEIAKTYWLSAGKRPNGMVIRLQGFDRGLFGGSFHTSNLLQHMPPGVDVVCYSNGEDYVRGFRNAMVQAKAGRVVMSVDCTNLLNLRHVHGKDRRWEFPYPPADENGLMSFDCVRRRYGERGSWCIVTYGNGVVTALQARRSLAERGIISSEDELDVIDSPYLSGIPNGLRLALKQDRYSGLLFADICKDGPGNPLATMACLLHREGLLPTKWEHVAAPRTYNPLGSMCTFLSEEDIVAAFHKLTSDGQSDRRDLRSS
jgi:2-oxoisovalerate dehydrogenase E1 component